MFRKVNSFVDVSPLFDVRIMLGGKRQNSEDARVKKSYRDFFSQMFGYLEKSCDITTVFSVTFGMTQGQQLLEAIAGSGGITQYIVNAVGFFSMTMLFGAISMMLRKKREAIMSENQETAQFTELYGFIENFFKYFVKCSVSVGTSSIGRMTEFFTIKTDGGSESSMFTVVVTLAVISAIFAFITSFSKVVLE